MASNEKSRSNGLNGSHGSHGSRGRNGHGADEDGPERRRTSRLSAREAVQRVREDFPALLGRPVEAVLGVQRDDDGWEVMVQVVELARVPRTTDVLGAYRVVLDDDGELIGYNRRRRYGRGQTDED